MANPQQRWMREHYRKNKAAGICVRCYKEPVQGQLAHCSSCLEKLRAKSARQRRELRMETFRIYGGRCRCCGEEEETFLEMDHMNEFTGDREKRSGHLLYAWLKRHGYPEGFQILCRNCNWAKSYRGVCPHQEVP